MEDIEDKKLACIKNQKTVIAYLTEQNRELIVENVALRIEADSAFDAGRRRGLDEGRPKRRGKAKAT
jgi:hypothetical protein